MKYFNTLLFVMGISIPATAQYHAAPVFVTSVRPAQPGAEPGKCIDGDTTTVYHSNWSLNAMPDTVDFYFSNISDINRIAYVPRPTGLNGVWRTVELYYRKADSPFVKVRDLSWANENTTKVIDLTGSELDEPAYVRFIVKTATGNFSSCGEMRFWTTVEPTLAIDCENPANGLSSLMDTKVSVASVAVNPPANSAGEAIGLTVDNNKSTFYHSSWAGGGFPIEMTYNFSGNNRIDYIVYTPRQDGGGNGHFGNMEVWYKATPGSAAVKVKDAQLGFSGTPSRITLSSPLVNPATVIIKVLSGQGNFASCAEMEFFTKNTASTSIYSHMFDSLYAVLKPGVTQAQIDTMSMPFFKTLAQCIFNQSYRKKFRLQHYQVYPVVSTTAATLKTSTYNSFENPTGIAFKANTKAVLFVGPTNGFTPSLRVTDLALGTNITDHTYILQEGLNVIDITADGLGYINYYSNDSSRLPIAIHIATGRVNGVYDPLTDTDADWFEYLTNGIYPSLDIKGRYMHMNYHKAALVGNTLQSGVALAAAYDSIVKTEYQLMGLFKYNRVPKNHMFAYSAYSGGWYAGGWGAHFDLTWGEAGLCTAQGVLADPWGIAHEFGHVNQVRPGFKWTGTTEVTNNLYSTWCQYTMGSAYPSATRLEGETISVDGVRPGIIGGRINGAILYGAVQKKPIMGNGDVFRTLVPFWQLELYYQSAGASKNLPTLQQRLAGTPAPGGGQPDVAFWLGDMLEKVRLTNEAGLSDGQLILNCVSNICDVVKEDLTDFFVKAGLLVPIDEVVNDYTSKRITITQQQVDSTITAIQAKGYSQPVSSVINYLSANSVNIYLQMEPVTGTAGVGATYSNNVVTVDPAQWQHAVAFETYKNDTLIDVAIAGTGSSNNSLTKVQFPDTATTVYAVGYDGERKLVYPASAPLIRKVNPAAATSAGKSSALVFPNPASSYVQVVLSGTSKAVVTIRLTDMTGNIIQQQKARDGETARVDLSRVTPGMYLLQIVKGFVVETKKIVKQ
ncbi:M60 family metallopeptidase [Chitinophaga barathri]|nr:M60 family metallopeptidase [Chitinophaga barathri]